MLTSNRNPIPHIFIPEISSLTRISKTINRNRILFTNLIIEITILIRFLYTKSIPAKRLNTIESATSKHCFAIFIFSRIPSSANIPLLRTRKANIMKIASYIKYLYFSIALSSLVSFKRHLLLKINHLCTYSTQCYQNSELSHNNETFSYSII